MPRYFLDFSKRNILVAMEKESRAFLNSPVIQTNTPIKRLGLSRKRKSCNFKCHIDAKIQVCEKLTESLTHSEKFLLDGQVQSDTKDKEEKGCSSINYDEEIDLLKKNIAEKKEKLKTLQWSKNNIKELENLIDIWKKGCKNAYLHFMELLKDRQSDCVDFRTVLNKLGIWETMTENFESDSEIFP